MTLRGYVDLHNHQFAHLGFGGVEFFGQPVGPIESALPWCTGAHGLGGAADVIGTFLKFAYNYPGAGLGHHVGGYPEFDGWPRWDSITHQTVHLDWLSRAWQGGLRLMVMLAVNNEWMCRFPGVPRAAGRTCRDMEAVDLQLQAAKDLEALLDQAAGGAGRGWYRIVRTAAEAESVIQAGKLAVVLGIEVDYLFDSYPDSPPDAGQIKAAVQKYYDAGVRYVFPIHFADNAFGGTAFQNAMQSDGVAVQINTPLGTFETPYVLQTEDGTSLGYEREGGRRNARGLTDLGRLLLQEVIGKGMLFDVDHMSYKSRAEALGIAEAANYPVVSGHTGFIDVCLGDKRHEGQMTGAEVERIRALGGMVAPIIAQGSIDTIKTWHRPDGTSVPHRCGGSTNSFVQAYLYAVEKMRGGAVGLGTDFNGFAGVPGPRTGPDACPGGRAGPAVHEASPAYPITAVSGVQLDRSQIGNKSFDIADDGPVHVGMLPDLIADIAAMGVREPEIEPLRQSAKSFVGVWQKADHSNVHRESAAIVAITSLLLGPPVAPNEPPGNISYLPPLLLRG
jgi:microsomal dipeptidase-like Zn-dependent dipeptidase